MKTETGRMSAPRAFTRDWRDPFLHLLSKIRNLSTWRDGRSYSPRGGGGGADLPCGASPRSVVRQNAAVSEKSTVPFAIDDPFFVDEKLGCR